MKRLPAIIFDVDGVLKAGSKPIHGAKEIMQMLLTNMHDGHKIPFKILSNGGGIHEKHKAVEITTTLQLHPHSITADDLILCHTPLKQLLPIYKHKHVLTAGVGDCANVATSYGYQHVIALEEYSALFPSLSRLSIMPYSDKIERAVLY